MTETKVPGIAAKRVVITDECRTIHGDIGAFHKAVFQLLKEFDSITRARVGEKGLNYHLTLTVEDTKRKPTEDLPERALPVTPPSTCLPPDDPKPSKEVCCCPDHYKRMGQHVDGCPLGKAQVRAPAGNPSETVERPPVDPPRKPN